MLHSSGRFGHDPAVRATGRQYLSTAAPMYAFIGLSIAMYFSSQGAAKVLGPVLAQTARLLFIGIGGWWLMSHGATAAVDVLDQPGRLGPWPQIRGAPR